MQVKKFEAKTMKEALDLIKKDLGPEAIILSVRERTSGLLGAASIEVSAAISADILEKKKYVESRLPEELKERYGSSSARSQKSYISKMVDNQPGREEETSKFRPQTQRRYIDIEDEPGEGRDRVSQIQTQLQSQLQTRSPGRSKTYKPPIPPKILSLSQPVAEDPSNRAEKNIREAVQNAWREGQKSFLQKDMERRSTRGSIVTPADHRINVLKREVQKLRQELEKYRRDSKKPEVILHPGAEYGLCYEVSDSFRRLKQWGFSERNARNILLRAQKELSFSQIQKRGLVLGWTAKFLMKAFDVIDDPFAKGLHVFVGPNGEGKTSMLVKMAAQLVVKKRGQLAIVSADVFKVGATEQLRIYSQILGVPFFLVRQKRDWRDLESQLQGFDYVLFDSPGLQLNQSEEVDLFHQIMPPSSWSKSIHYVQAVTSDSQAAMACARRFKLSRFTDVIFTQLDEAIQFGSIYNFQVEFEVPVHSLGMGAKIPEDFEMATKERLIDLIFHLGPQRRKQMWRSHEKSA